MCSQNTGNIAKRHTFLITHTENSGLSFRKNCLTLEFVHVCSLTFHEHHEIWSRSKQGSISNSERKVYLMNIHSTWFTREINFLVFLYLKILLLTPIISSTKFSWQTFLLKLNPAFSVITCMPFGYFTCVLRARFKEVLQVAVF